MTGLEIDAMKKLAGRTAGGWILPAISRMGLAWGWALAAVALSCPSGQADADAAAQTNQGTAAATAPVFDVASIRPTRSREAGRSHIVSSAHDGHFTAINVTLKQLLQWAFAMPEGRVLGGPAWQNSAKFDIEAKADESADEHLRGLDGDAGNLEKQKMVQALLADRFQLRSHAETRTFPIYALVVGKNGPRLEPSTANGTSINGRKGQIAVRGSDHTVSLLVDQLTKVLDRVVVDKTGIDGRFDLSLTWTPEDGDAAPKFAAAPGSLSDTARVSIFTAIQEQMGLKLVPQKGPVQALVIDHVEMPSEN